MRTKQEITNEFDNPTEEVIAVASTVSTVRNRIVVEVLLDLRDLLKDIKKAVEA